MSYTLFLIIVSVYYNNLLSFISYNIILYYRLYYDIAYLTTKPLMGNFYVGMIVVGILV